MKNRLIELLGKADDATEILTGDFPSYEEELQAFYSSIADYLLDNGVIVLPCAVGDTVWCIDSFNLDGTLRKQPIIREIKFNHHLEFVGKTVFLTKEEAEAKLKELEGVKE